MFALQWAHIKRPGESTPSNNKNPQHSPIGKIMLLFILFSHLVCLSHTTPAAQIWEDSGTSGCLKNEYRLPHKYGKNPRECRGCSVGPKRVSRTASTHMNRRTPPTTQGEEKQFQTLSPNRHWQRKPLKIRMCHKTVQNLPRGVNLVAEQIHIPS